MKVLRLILLGSLLLLAGCLPAVAATTVPVTSYIPVEVLNEVEIPKETLRIEYVYIPEIQYEYLWKEPRQFRDIEELCDYLASIPVLIPAEGQDCDDIALRFMLNALQQGYLVSTEIIDNFRGQGMHMLNSTIIGNSIYYIEPSTNECWWATPLD